MRAVVFPLVLSGLVAGCADAPADAPADCLPTVEDGWIRPAPPGMPMAAGFGRIVNTCEAPVAITGATSEAFGDVSLHETTDVDGVSRMRHTEALDLPAGGEAVLAPGGHHLMLSEFAGELAPGDRVAIDLVLADGRTVRGDFEVRSR